MIDDETLRFLKVMKDIKDNVEKVNGGMYFWLVDQTLIEMAICALKQDMKKEFEWSMHYQIENNVCLGTRNHLDKILNKLIQEGEI